MTGIYETSEELPSATLSKSQFIETVLITKGIFHSKSRKVADG